MFSDHHWFYLFPFSRPPNFCAWNIPAGQLHMVPGERVVGPIRITVNTIAAKLKDTNHDVALGFLDPTVHVDHPPAVRC